MSGYTALENKVIQNSQLSLCTKGLYAFLCSLDNDLTDEEILNLQCCESKEEIKNALEELVMLGYAKREGNKC